MSNFNSSDRIRRAKHSANYTLILNETIRDQRLSWKARGIHHYILSLPDTWEINIAHLEKQSDKDGIDSIKSGLKELESYGYISKEQVRDGNGKFSKTQWTVYEEPQVDFPQAVRPEVEKPSTVKPSTENPSLRNNYIEIIQETNNQEEINTPLPPKGELLSEEIPFSDFWEPENPEPEQPEIIEASQDFPEPASLAKNLGVGKISPAAAKKSKATKKAEIAQCFEAFAFRYNELMGDIWAKCSKATDDRLRRFAKTWAENKEDLFVNLEYASRFLHQADWALKKPYQIDTLLWEGRLTKYAEAGEKIITPEEQKSRFYHEVMEAISA